MSDATVIENRRKQAVKMIVGIFLALVIPIAGTFMTEAPLIWPVSTLIYNLGLVCCFSMAPKGAARVIVYNILGATLLVVESSFFFSYYMQNTGFNEAFFYHIRPDLLYAGVKEHLPVLLSILGCLVGSLALSSSGLARSRAGKGWMPVLGLALVVFGLLISPPARSIVRYAEKHSLEAKGDDPFEVFPELRGSNVAAEFVGSKRPNIVLIYAESLEQRYFDETVFPGLLPNLKRLRGQSLDFSNVSQGVGAGWTVGGMVASQCGYPLAGSHGVTGNDFSVFDQFLPKATCLGDLLDKDGYRLTFIGGADARFAGKGLFLGSHGYSEILDLNSLLGDLVDKSYRNDWGVFDDTLFDDAFREYSTLTGR